MKRRDVEALRTQARETQARFDAASKQAQEAQSRFYLAALERDRARAALAEVEGFRQ